MLIERLTAESLKFSSLTALLTKNKQKSGKKLRNRRSKEESKTENERKNTKIQRMINRTEEEQKNIADMECCCTDRWNDGLSSQMSHKTKQVKRQTRKARDKTWHGNCFSAFNEPCEGYFGIHSRISFFFFHLAYFAWKFISLTQDKTSRRDKTKTSWQDKTRRHESTW